MVPNMLEALEAIDHVGEVARLFLVLARWGKPRMEEQALLAACKRTAGLATRYPRPAPAIAIATAAGLISRSRGAVFITDRGGRFASQGTPGAIDLTQPQAMLLLGALLDNTNVERAIASLVSNFQLVHGQLHARKNSIQPATTQVLVCRLLQQLGAISASGDYYVISKAFDALLAHLIIQAAKLTQAELLRRLELQRQRGDLAEQKALEIEKSRLADIGRPDLAARVERVSPHDVSAGYDIRSFEKNERPRLVEVKSSVGSQITFEWSVGERATATKHGEAYFIYFVPFSFNLPELTSPVVLLKNPIELIRSGRLAETPSNFHVTEPHSLGTASPKPRSSPVSPSTTYVYR
jgi:hypothetical protein